MDVLLIYYAVFFGGIGLIAHAYLAIEHLYRRRARRKARERGEEPPVEPEGGSPAGEIQRPARSRSRF